MNKKMTEDKSIKSNVNEDLNLGTAEKTIQKRRKGCLFFLITALILFLLFNLFVFFFLMGKILDLKKSFGGEFSKNLTEEYISYVNRTEKVNELILIKMDSVEFISQEFSNSVSLPKWQWLRGILENDELSSKAKIEIICPVEYNVFVDLNSDKWQLKIVNNVAYVLAPKIQIKKPTIDFANLKIYRDSGYFVFGEEKKEEKMKQGLIKTLKEKFAQKHMKMVIGNCRDSLREYFKKWILGKKYKVDSVIIMFEDEKNVLNNKKNF